MEAEDAFNFVNELLMQKTQTSLNECEKDIVLGIWNNQTYQEISDLTHRYEQYLRETGPKLFNKIHEALGIKVNKRNLKPAIESLWQQSQKISNSPELGSRISNLSSRETPSHTSQLNYGNNGEFKVSNFNPFIPPNGIVDDPQLFFNRDEELNRIFEIFNSNSSVALIGEEGIGKSSLLFIICQQAKDRLTSPRTAIYLDIIKIKNEEDFYTALCGEIGISQVRGYQLNRALQKQRILLALDNLGKITRDGFTRELRDHLRGLAEGSNAPLRLILAASEPLENLFYDSQEGGKTSPLAGICLPEYIKPWNENTACKFIETRLQTTPVRFTEPEIGQLIEESAGHPRKLMQLCYQCYQKYSRAHH
ncbi:hypothetical protein NG798_03610 [Ancylothrix sp. C2]|uniref:AAA family ATPase n=1 Tax=Ancylothrix sp. D3o TaxID=2953691 RepID=UPI0021BAB5DD|nr:AAA family ATPase [Ancylothrix sp. D3o]MCT7948863.1 hypothetical protein [Ancylothrix sp. D3o]